MVNQQSGFDCTSCAWPDPSHRNQFEFCENGAKVVADEATTRRVTPQFSVNTLFKNYLKKVTCG